MVPEKPYPPNQPSIFCEPCAKKTSPSTNLRMAVAGFSSVTSNLRGMYQLLSAESELRQPIRSITDYHYIKIPSISVKICWTVNTMCFELVRDPSERNRTRPRNDYGGLFQFTPKSLRLIAVVATNPAR